MKVNIYVKQERESAALELGEVQVDAFGEGESFAAAVLVHLVDNAVEILDGDLVIVVEAGDDAPTLWVLKVQRADVTLLGETAF